MVQVAARTRSWIRLSWYTRGMGTPLDLSKASREELLAVIAELQDSIVQLQQRVAALEDRSNTRGSPGMRVNKPSSARFAPRKAIRKR